MALCGSARGVIIVAGDGTGNTTAPSAEWNNVGVRGSASAVYLGNRWVLTAAHVGPGDVVLGGKTYAWDSRYSRRIRNPEGSGLSSLTDLVIFRLLVDPGLPSLNISGTSAAVGQTVLMIGAGRNRKVDLTAWNVAMTPGPNNDVWTPQSGGAEEGYLWADDKTMRWGENVVGSIIATYSTADVNTGFGDVRSFMTTFDKEGLPNEAQAAFGDSGGGVFLSGNHLVGIMHAIATEEGQPNAAVFGNVTFCADLAFYRDDILRLNIVHEPVGMVVDQNGRASTTIEASGVSATSFQWQWRAGPSSPWMNLVDGAFAPVGTGWTAQVSGSHSPGLSVQSPLPFGPNVGEAPSFRCLISDEYGQATSQSVSPIPDLDQQIVAENLELCWVSQANTDWRVQYSMDLSAGSWFNLGGIIHASGASTCLSNVSTSGLERRFYRVFQVVNP